MSVWSPASEAELHHRRRTLGPHSPTDKDIAFHSDPKEGDIGAEISPDRLTEECTSAAAPGEPSLRSLDTLTVLASNKFRRPHTICNSSALSAPACEVEEFCETEGQRLLLWSHMNPHPMVFAGESPRTHTGKPATLSPKEAALYSLGNAGLRSFLQPPPLIPRKEWLRQLLLEIVEDATLFFSCLIDECQCGSTPIREDWNAEQRNEITRDDSADPPIALDAKPAPPKSAATSDVSRGLFAKEYISSTLSWCRQLTQDSHLFPPLESREETGNAAPESTTLKRNLDYLETAGIESKGEVSVASNGGLVETAQQIVRRLLRCYIHAYLQHLPLLMDFGVVAHVNRSLKKLIFVAHDAQLLKSSECSLLKPLAPLLEEWLVEGAEQASFYQWSPEETRAVGGATLKTREGALFESAAKHRKSFVLALEQAETELAQFDESR